MSTETIKRKFNQEKFKNTKKPKILSPLQEYISNFSKEYDEHNERSERIYKLSRDITISSKKIIFNLHRINEFNKDKTLKDSEDLLTKVSDLIIKINKELIINVKNYERYNYRYTFGLQEYIEALSFYYYIKENRLILKHEIEELNNKF